MTAALEQTAEVNGIIDTVSIVWMTLATCNQRSCCTIIHGFRVSIPIHITFFEPQTSKYQSTHNPWFVNARNGVIKHLTIMPGHDGSIDQDTRNDPRESGDYSVYKSETHDHREMLQASRRRRCSRQLSLSMALVYDLEI